MGVCIRDCQNAVSGHGGSVFLYCVPHLARRLFGIRRAVDGWAVGTDVLRIAVDRDGNAGRMF